MPEELILDAGELDNDSRAGVTVLDLAAREADKVAERAKPVDYEARLSDPIEQMREKARYVIAYLLIAALFLIMTCSFGWLIAYCRADGCKVADVKDVVEIFVTPLVGLIGAVIGFYFGTEKKG